MSWVQIEQLCTDVLFLIVAVSVLTTVIKIYKKVNQIEKDVSFLKEDHKFDRANCKKRLMEGL